MQSSQHVKYQRDERDWEIFTSNVLLLSAAARLARDEIDALITAGTNHDLADRLRRARRGVATLASIADYYNEETAGEP